jgi:hypothetical protein
MSCSSTCHFRGCLSFSPTWPCNFQYFRTLCTLRRTQALLSDDHWPAGAAGVWATPPHPPGPQDSLRDYGPDGAADAAADLSAPHDLSRDYGPTGSSGRRRRLRQGRSTFRGIMGRTDPPEGCAGVHCGKRTTQPRDPPGAGRRVSPMLRI